MKKTEIEAMSKEELFIFIIEMETKTTHESHTSRGITKQSKKKYRWALDQAEKLYGLDLEKIKKNPNFDYLWID